MGRDLSHIYKNIFETYLNFCPYFRRNLVDLNEMWNWVKDLDLKRPYISHKHDFFIFMEWLSALEFIKPLCKLTFPKEQFSTNSLKISTKSLPIEELYREELISFPQNLYNLKNISPKDAAPWNYRKYRPFPKDENDYRTFREHDLDLYLYHPIQFFQLLNFLREGFYERFSTKKDHIQFYWIRRFKLKDSYIKIINDTIKENSSTVEEFINKEMNKSIGYHGLEFEFFRNIHWLEEDQLELWIKFESIIHISFIRPSNSGRINIRAQISIWESIKEGKYYYLLKDYNNWRSKILNNFIDEFDIKDFSTLKEFIEWSGYQLRYEGLEEFRDILLLINERKKSKLKGYLNFFVNLLQILKLLRKFHEFFTSKFPELDSDKYIPKWYDPQYNIDEKSSQEKEEYLQKILLDYDLILEDTFILYVEGDTEEIILEDWLNLVYQKTRIKINLKKLGGKKNSFVFEFLIKNFNAKDHFLILDADKPGDIEGRRNNLEGKGILKESYYIFSPDFITENFKPDEIIEALKLYIKEINELKRSAGSPEISISDEHYADFKDLVRNGRGHLVN